MSWHFEVFNLELRDIGALTKSEWSGITLKSDLNQITNLSQPCNFDKGFLTLQISDQYELMPSTFQDIVPKSHH